MSPRRKSGLANRIWRSADDAGASWAIHCGDARQVLCKLQDESFDCVITSPPYYWQRDYGVTGQTGMERSVDEYVESIVDTMVGIRRVLKKDGALFLNLGDTYYSGKGRPHGHDPKHRARRMNVLRAVDASGLGFPQKSLLGLPWRIANRMVDSGWILRAPIIWQRSRPLPEANARDRPWRTYEFVFLFTRSSRYRFKRKALETAKEEDIWSIDTRSVAGRTHPAAFPIELVERCLDTVGLRKGHVMDPFAGSCTVLKVAARRGLNATGIDLNPAFCQQSAAELARLTTNPIFNVTSSLGTGLPRLTPSPKASSSKGASSPEKSSVPMAPLLRRRSVHQK